jgi:dual specificity tyrosine-phosphorylation-regulated kinase 2/3/4
VHFQTFEKKKYKVIKKNKKAVNYTTIRKQIPSFERSVESTSTGYKVFKQKISHIPNNPSLNGSSIVHNLNTTNKNSKNKSENIGHLRSWKDSKVIRFSKNIKGLPKKYAKQKTKEGISKWEIDLSKMTIAASSRLHPQNLSKEWSVPKQKVKSLSVRKSLSPEHEECKVQKEDEFPMPPGKALKLFMDTSLNSFEQSEILDYKQIYFVGKTQEKLSGEKQNQNNGFDDDRGDYKIVINDHIAYRYEIISRLGQGSFGQVIKVFDHKENKNLALKVIRNKKKFIYQANVEIKILKDIKKNDPKDKSNIIKILDNFIFRNHIWLTFDLFSINLYELIKSNHHNGFPLDIIRRFAIQILQALRFLRKREVIHWDLKPENILLKKSNKTGIKIIDLGSSWYQTKQVYTYIQSRFYRAPEIMLGIPYTTAIDMWSFACILVELFIGYPLFPGESEEEQLALIMEYKGVPPINLLKNATRKELFFNQDMTPIPVRDNLGEEIKVNSKALSQLLWWGTTEEQKDWLTQFVKFIDGWLHWDPELRMTPSEALHHEWISSIFGKL